MADNRTFLQKVRGIKPTDIGNYSLPTENDDTFFNSMSMQYEDRISKGYDGKEKGIQDPPKDSLLLGRFNVENNRDGYARRISRVVPRNVLGVLRAYSTNSVISAIINTRVNQVTNYARPASTAQDGIGYQVRLKDGSEPTPEQQKTINRCMRFIENMGTDYDPTRDDFKDFLRKLTRDSLIYDQVPIERTYDTSRTTPDGKAILDHVSLIDATTFAFLIDKSTGKRRRTGNIYAQVIDGKIERQFDTREMSVFIRNKSTDQMSYGYGRSELESALREVFAQENAEQFNDRFFTNGGTVRGILNVKMGGNPSRPALEQFKRQWHAALEGGHTSWTIPLMSAEDVKFVNLTPDAQDMQYEKWFNYLINVICAIYCIDPSEIGMTNRGGATGSKGNSLNEGNSKDKISISKDKGLTPLLTLIANFITNEIIRRVANSNYVFEFVGGDIENRIKEASLNQQLSSSIQTINEVRIASGLPSLGAKGDFIANGSYIQYQGQIQQKEITKFQQQTELVTMLEQHIQEVVNQPDTPDISGISYQDMQAGMDGKPAKPSGKDNQEGTGKDGQAKQVENTNSSGQGGKNHKKK